MITVSNDFKTELESNNRLFTVKVLVKRNSESLSVDLSDRVESIDIQNDFDRRSSNCNIEFDNYDYLLSPLNENSSLNKDGVVYDPILDSMHEITVQLGIFISSTGQYEYVTLFTGVMGDEISINSLPPIININARDKSKYLQDIYVYQGKSYQAMVVENVIQDMITQFAPQRNITVTVANPTEFMIGKPGEPYTAKDIRLWDAIQSVADVASHELRFLEDGTLRLKLVDRNIQSKTPDIHLNEYDLARDDMDTSDADIRNYIVMKLQGFDPIEKKNQSSIAKYGVRYMEVQRSVTKIFNTVEQAHKLAEDMLMDLSTIHPQERVEIPLNPLIQVGDIVTLENKRIGTTETKMKYIVRKVSHSYSADRKRTSLTLEGYQADFVNNSPTPNGVVNLRYEMLERTIQNYQGSGWTGKEKTMYYPRLMWDAPTTYTDNTVMPSDFGGYIIYRKKTSETDWYAVASIQSYILSLEKAINYFYDYTSDEGVSYDYMVKAISKFGKSSSDSTTITLTVPTTVITQ